MKLPNIIYLMLHPLVIIGTLLYCLILPDLNPLNAQSEKKICLATHVSYFSNAAVPDFYNYFKPNIAYSFAAGYNFDKNTSLFLDVSFSKQNMINHEGYITKEYNHLNNIIKNPYGGNLRLNSYYLAYQESFGKGEKKLNVKSVIGIGLVNLRWDAFYGERIIDNKNVEVLRNINTYTWSFLFGGNLEYSFSDSFTAYLTLRSTYNQFRVREFIFFSAIYLGPGIRVNL